MSVELVPTVPVVPCKIECAAIWATNLYIGSADGRLFQYVLEKVPQGERFLVKSQLQNSRVLSTRKPIEQISLMPGPGKLLALCESTLYMLNMYSLELWSPDGKSSAASPSTSPPLTAATSVIPPWKGVISFGTQKGSTEFRFCVQLKKKLVLYEFTSRTAIELINEIPLTEQAVALVGSQDIICVATKKEYLLLNLLSLRLDVLTSHDSRHPPLVVVAGNELLLYKEGQGFFFSFSGAPSARPPIPFQGTPSQLACNFPYIIALHQRSIEIYSMMTSQLVQTIILDKPPYPNFSILQEGCDPQDFIALANSFAPACVYVVDAATLKEQVIEMLKAGQNREAFEWFRFCLAGRDGKQLPKDFEKRLMEMHSIAGSTLFELTRFNEAVEHYLVSDTAPQSVIGYFPDLLPEGSHFLQPTDIAALVKSKISVADPAAIEERIIVARRCLMEFLEKKREQMKTTINPEEVVQDITTALIKLYVHFKPNKLVELIKTSALYHSSMVEDYLALKKCWYPLSTLYNCQKRYRNALLIWAKFGTGEFTDPLCTGVDDTIFTLNPRPETIVTHDQVLTFLTSLSDDSIVQMYLENIIFNLHVKEEKFHTRLAFIYIQCILRHIAENHIVPHIDPTKEPPPLGEYRTKLASLFKLSSAYNASMLLSQIHDTTLYEEQISLYKQIGSHNRVLQLMVHQLNDCERAEQYCISHSSPNQLFLILLQIYIEMGNPASPPAVQPTDTETPQICPLPQRAVDLLNKHARNIDLLQVLPYLPDSLSLQTILPCITKAMQENFDSWRTGQITKNLYQACTIMDKVTLIRNTEKAVIINEQTTCPVCGTRINRRVVARYPNGVVVCFKCIKTKNICPVTGRDFSKYPASLS
ncbi:transforming growth factor-beta receptor-associated protein 1 [Pelomyxa schiedti]|nr:transforming growth factor-beta receptor-associated protein 1 [Pelomyxa schiedti]